MHEQADRTDRGGDREAEDEASEEERRFHGVKLREQEKPPAFVPRVFLSDPRSAPTWGAAHQLERALAGRCCDEAAVTSMR